MVDSRGWGAYAWDKNTSARDCAKMGTYAGGDLRDTTVYEWKYCNYSNTTYDPV